MMLGFAIFQPYVWAMDQLYKRRNEYRSWKKGYYHLSSDGWADGQLFYTAAQYAYGMILMGLLALRFTLTIYSFTLMPNHIHILMSGNGDACVEAFEYFKRKLSARLKADGYPPLPADYGFKLTPIEDEGQMRLAFLYLDRNAYEKNLSVPGGYPWGCAYYHHSQLGMLFQGTKASELSQRNLIRITGSKASIPSEWVFHPLLGLLPDSYINNRLFHKLFPSPKDYESRLVKEYEAFAKLGQAIGETQEYSNAELKDIANTCSRSQFAGKAVFDLSHEEKCRLCSHLHKTYVLNTAQLSYALALREHLVRQILASKEYGVRH